MPAERNPENQRVPPTVHCPNCGRAVEWSKNSKFRPFCSERCRLVDLGEWFGETHYIPDENAPPYENEPGG